MLLQPYVENAIRHGMRFLENKKGQININVFAENNFLVCEIDDNGIGREKAAALKSKRHMEYQSKGMNISKRRAELYNIQPGSNRQKRRAWPCNRNNCDRKNSVGF